MKMPSSPSRSSTNTLSSSHNLANNNNNTQSQSTSQSAPFQKPRFDSPGHTSVTTTVSSFDTEDNNELTPLPLEERLGRVITDDDDIVEQNENDVLASIVLPPRRPSMSRRTISAGSAQYDHWLHQDCAVEAMAANTLQELQQLNRLASMDSNEYHAQLLDNSLPSLQSSTTNLGSFLTLGGKEQSGCAASPSSPLAHIPNQMVQLSMSIHRLHSTVTNLTQEVDGHTDDTKDLQAQLLASQERNQQLEAAMKKVYLKNQKLKQNAETEKAARKQLQKQLQEYEHQLETQNFELMASQVQQHELRLLQQKQRQQQEEMSSVASSGNRTDSPFSELCLEDIGIDVPEDVKDDTSSFASSTRPTLCFSAQGSIDSAIARVRTFSSTSVASISSSVGIEKPIGEENSSKSSEEEETVSNEPEETKTQCADESAVSTQLSEKSQEEEKRERKDAKPPLPGIMSSLNMGFAFLGNRQASNYTLRMSPPFKMQFALLEVDATDPENNTVRKEKAFVVVGFRGFDDFTNVRPTLGARLMEINDSPINQEWNADALLEELYGKKASKSLCFRNDEWTAAQKKELNAVIAKNNAAAKAGAAGSRGDAKQTKAAINKEQPPLRSRAGSAEAVGKAIGNLFKQ